MLHSDTGPCGDAYHSGHSKNHWTELNTVPAFAFPAEAGAHLLIPEILWDGKLSWPWVDGWLHTDISVRHREFNPDTVAHLSTNRAQRRLTSLIEANALTTTPDHQTK